MRIETTRFGPLEVAAEDVIEFPRGLFGFEEVDHFVLVERPEGSILKWLQAVGRPDLAFVVLDPSVFPGDYQFELSGEDRAALGCTRQNELMVWVIVGIPEDPREMTANLKGPILINPGRRLGRQILLEGDGHSPRYRIVDAIRGAQDPGSRARD